MTTTTLHGSSNSKDFDFFIGSWEVTHRRLKERLSDCHIWESFNGNTTTQKILGGAGNFDDNVLHMPHEKYYALTLRTFNEKDGMWSIWWLDGRHPNHLDTPMKGAFVNNIGTFYSKDQFNGRSILVRFLWSIPEPNAPHWEQAFSLDNGETWETNWIMDFKKVE